MIAKTFTSIFLAIFALSVLFSCSEAVKPTVSEPVEPEIEILASEVVRAFGLVGTSFIHNEIVDLDTVTYKPAYTRAFLENIEFNAMKACRIDPNNDMPDLCIGLDDSVAAFHGFLRVYEMSPVNQQTNEYIELYFFPFSPFSPVSTGCPSVLKNVSYIEDAYVGYYGKYVDNTNLTLNNFRCNRFSATVYPRYTPYDSLGFLDDFLDSFVVDIRTGEVLIGRTWEAWKSDSAKNRMGLSASALMEVPIKFLRIGRYVNEYTGCKTISLIDSLVFTSGRVALIRVADSIDAFAGTPSAKILRIIADYDKSFECEWTSGVKHTFASGTGFRSSQKTFTDRSHITIGLETGTLNTKRTSNSTLDSLRFVLSGDTLEWNKAIANSSFSGKIYWSLRQVCSRFDLAEKGIYGWATFNPWTEIGTCYVKNIKGLVFVFTFSTNTAVPRLNMNR